MEQMQIDPNIVIDIQNRKINELQSQNTLLLAMIEMLKKGKEDDNK